MVESKRPYIAGPTGLNQPLDGNEEVALRVISNSSGNPIFMGKASTGTTDALQKWQLRKLTYDSSGNFHTQLWAKDENGFATSKFGFKWDDGTSATITDITQANPAVVTTAPAHGLTDGDIILITGVTGMIEVNFTGNNFYKVANSAATTFELTDTSDVDIDSSGFAAYTAAGTVSRPNYANELYG